MLPAQYRASPWRPLPPPRSRLAACPLSFGNMQGRTQLSVYFVFIFIPPRSLTKGVLVKTSLLLPQTEKQPNTSQSRAGLWRPASLLPASCFLFSLSILLGNGHLRVPLSHFLRRLWDIRQLLPGQTVELLERWSCGVIGLILCYGPNCLSPPPK